MFNQQRFHLSFPKSRGDYFVFALPQSNHYQTIFNPKYSPVKHTIITIDKNNCLARTLIINLNDVSNNITISFRSQPKTVLVSSDFDFEMEDYNNINLSKYLIPSHFVNGNDRKIKQLVEQNTRDSDNVAEIINDLYRFTLDYLTYGKPTEKLYDYKQALGEKTTDCGGFSTFLASLLQSVGIPSRLVVGFLIKKPGLFNIFPLNFDSLTMHAWLEVLLPDKTWFPLDPAVEWRRNHHQSQREGGFGYLPADRLVTSFGQDFEIKIGNKTREFDILQKPIII